MPAVGTAGPAAPRDSRMIAGRFALNGVTATVRTARTELVITTLNSFVRDVFVVGL